MENCDIFISYKRRGASNYVSSYIYSFLKDKGYFVFLDREEMGSGEFNKQIYEHIQNATDVIVLLEEGSLKSITDGFSSEQLESSENGSMLNKIKKQCANTKQALNSTKLQVRLVLYGNNACY